MRLKILTICNVFPPYISGGNEIRCRMIQETLKKNHEVLVLTSQNENYLEEDWIDRSLIQIKPYPEKIWFHPLYTIRQEWISYRNYKITQKLLTKFRPDIAFVSNLKRIELGPAFALQEAGIPIIWDISDEYLIAYKRKRKIDFFRKYTRLDTLDFSRCILIADFLREKLINEEIIKPSSLYISMGVDQNVFNAKRNKNPRTPRKLLWIGSVIPDKGLHIVIQAMSQLSRDYSLTIIYSSQDEDYLRKIKKSVKENQLHAVNFKRMLSHKELAEEYKNHDIFLFSSIWTEPFAATPLEAMASATPVIGTEVGGTIGFFKHKENCLIYDSLSPDDLTKKIKLLDDENLYSHLQKCALDLVRTSYNFDAYAKKIEEYVEKVALEEKKQKSR